MKDELLATVSHELRTPLTSILSFLELLREEGGIAAGQREAFDVIDRNAHRLLDLVADLLGHALAGMSFGRYAAKGSARALLPKVISKLAYPKPL